MKLDLKKDGLEAFGFKDWEAPLIYKLLTDVNESEPMKTKMAHDFILDLGFKRSRASVIFFLRDMNEAGLLAYSEESGKGGMHKVYWGCKGIMDFLTDIRMQVDEKIMAYADTLP